MNVHIYLLVFGLTVAFSAGAFVTGLRRLGSIVDKLDATLMELVPTVRELTVRIVHLEREIYAQGPNGHGPDTSIVVK